MENFEEILNELKNRWFLMEPAYFMVLCTHKIEITQIAKCDIAVGGGVIRINPEYFKDRTEKFFDERMKCEVLRILLKHPYQRQLPNIVKMFMSSNFVIANNTDFSNARMMKSWKFFGTNEFDKASLEEIYDNISLKMPDAVGGKSKDDESGQDKPNGQSGSSNQKNKKPGANKNAAGKYEVTADDLSNFDDAMTSCEDAFEKTQFWKEDEYRQVEINAVIDKIDKSRSWGNMPGDIVERIKKSIEPKFNYKAIFQQFRSTVLSSSRTITRMKPNRRTGYQNPGSKRDFTTKILVAVDTSGSISSEDLALALGFINKFFKYGIDEISCIQFDTEIHPRTLEKLTKKMKTFSINGRGGTDFNDVFRYAQTANPIFDGVIILTDGYASVPSKDWLSNNYKNVKYVWCLNDEANYKHFIKNTEFAKFGKATFVDKKYNNDED